MKTTCPHCGAVTAHAVTHSHFTVVKCHACSRDYLRRPAGRVLAVFLRRFGGVATRYEVTGILQGRPTNI